MATYTGTSLRVVEARAADGDSVEDSTLIGPSPNWPICIGAKGLKFTNCRFVRCEPPLDAICDDRCTFDQRPLPPEPVSEEMIPMPRRELENVIAAARAGGLTDADEFCERHGLNLNRGLEVGR